MKKLVNWFATRVLKFRGIVIEEYTWQGKPMYVKCQTCQKEWKPTPKNMHDYMFGHINCPAVMVTLQPFVWKRA